MCQKLGDLEAGLVGYWRFNETSGTTCEDDSANGNDGETINMDPSSDRVCSSVPIGDDSAYDYTTFDVNLAHPDGDNLTATQDGGTWSAAENSGLHVYRMDNTPLFSDGSLFLQALGSASRTGAFLLPARQIPPIRSFTIMPDIRALSMRRILHWASGMRIAPHGKA